jgi:FKBP-type peptidyl-prolyl cis-trans isomerase
MKLIRSLSAVLCGAGLLAAATAQQNNNPVKFELPQVGNTAPAATTPATSAPAAAAPAAPAQTFTEAQMMEVYGWMMGARMNLRQLEFTPAQIDAMARGLKMAAAGQEPTYDAQQMSPQLQNFLSQKQQALLTKIRNFNLNEAAAFFTKLKENTAVKEITSGLRYEVLREGKGAVAKPGQLARIHYTGTFLNGQVFDTSLQQEGTSLPDPVEALVKDDAMIPGVYEAITRMPVGSKWRLFIPPHLAFGDDGAPQGGIPPAATLVYEIEVFEVKDAPNAPAAGKK